MKIKFTFLLLLLSFQLASYAQSNYKPGYVINLQGDTIKGFIDYKEWGKAPTTVDFKATPGDSRVQKFTTDNSKAFAVTNLEYFIAANVRISGGNVEESRLPTSIDSSYSNATVFLRTITSGKHLALFYYTDNIKTRYYVQDKSTNTVSELDYYVYLDSENNNIVQSVYAYRRQLTVFAVNYQPGNNALVQKIQSVKYDRNELKAIVVAINGGESTLSDQKSLSARRFFIGAGVKSSKLTFKGEGAPFPDGTNRTSVFPTISGGIDIVFNNNTQKLVFRTEAMVSHNQYNFIYLSPSDLQSGGSLDIKDVNAALIPQLIYNLYKGVDFKIFIDVGVAGTYHFYNNYSYTATYFDGLTNVQNKYPSFSQLDFSFPLKAGFVITKNVEIYGVYWISTSPVNNLYYSVPKSSYQAGINIFFGKN